MSEQEPTLKRGTRNFRGLRATLLILLAVLIVGISYVVTLGPVHMAHLRAESSDGERALAIGERTQITPPAEWVSEPLVRDLIAWPPLPPLKDWSVLVGQEPGLLLKTPDQKLKVEVTLVERSDVAAFLSDVAQDPDAEAGTEEDAVEPLDEVLASGLSVSHVAGPAEILAVVDTGGGIVGLRATTLGDANLTAYRPAIAQLLEAVRAG